MPTKKKSDTKKSDLQHKAATKTVKAMKHAGSKGGTSKIAVGAAGAVAGAAIGSVAAIALTDKNIQKQVGDVMKDLPQKANQTLDMLEKRTDQLSSQAKKNIETGKKLTKKV